MNVQFERCIDATELMMIVLASDSSLSSILNRKRVCRALASDIHGLCPTDRMRRVRRSLPACASISLEYRQHRAKREDVALAAERGRVQVRGAAPIKKKRVGAIQPVTK